jgi:ribosomal protein S18 acetylase RimI-like enzyme
MPIGSDDDLAVEVRAMTLQADPDRLHARAPSSEPWELDVLGPAEWQSLRTTRLRALADSPHAFVATYSTEAMLSEAYWRGRIESSTWLAAREGDGIIGVARMRGAHDEPEDVRYIESVWVHPLHRCKGVVRSMMEELELYALAARVARLRLWVLDTNRSAADAYVKLGFSSELPERAQRTTKVSAAGTLVYERRMVKELL